MARVLIRKTFAFEDVAQVTATVGADDLRATSVRIRNALHASREFVIETGPAAARLKLRFRRIQRVVAAPANEGSGRIKRFVLAAERPFRSLVDDDSFFIWRQLIV